MSGYVNKIPKAIFLFQQQNSFQALSSKNALVNNRVKLKLNIRLR